MDPTVIFNVTNAKRCRECWEELDEELGKKKANKTCRDLLEDVLGSSNYVMDVDLQDFAKTSRSGLLLRRDGLYVVIAGNHTDRSLLHIPLAHEHESTIGDDRFAWFMNDSSTAADKIDAAVAVQRLKAIVEPSWKEHAVGGGSVIANLAARAVVVMLDGAGRSAVYTQQEGRLIQQFTAGQNKALKSAKNAKNSFCARFPQVFTDAIRLLIEKHQRASPLFQFDTADPLVEEIQEDAIRIDAEFSTELLQVLTAPGSPLRHGVVIVRPEDTEAGFRIVSVTRRPIVVGCQEPTPVFEVPGARRKALEWLSRLTPATFVVVGEEPAGDFDNVRRLERGVWSDENVSVIADRLVARHSTTRTLSHQSRAAKVRKAIGRLFSKKPQRTLRSIDPSSQLRHLSTALSELSTNKTGALIVLQTTSSAFLEKLGRKADRLSVAFCDAVLVALFHKFSVLHDGGVVIDAREAGGDWIIRFSRVIFPLKSDDKRTRKRIPSDMGTRHRAASGISASTGLAVVAVSEETGRVSLWRDGAVHEVASVEEGIEHVRAELEQLSGSGKAVNKC